MLLVALEPNKEEQQAKRQARKAKDKQQREPELQSELVDWWTVTWFSNELQSAMEEYSAGPETQWLLHSSQIRSNAVSLDSPTRRPS